MRHRWRWLSVALIAALLMLGPNPAALALEPPPPPPAAGLPALSVAPSAGSGPTIVTAPDLSLNVAAPDTARLGVPVPAWVAVTNQGTATTAPVVITATLPLTASFLSAGGPGWACGGVAVGAVGGTLVCSLPSLTAATVSTITVQFSPSAAPLELGLLAAVVATDGESNPGQSSDDIVRAGAHSANNNPWDVQDQQLFPTDPGDGGVSDGGQDAFDGWGMLKLRIFDGGGSLLAATDELADFGLAYALGHRWRTTTPVVTDTIQVARSLYAPAHADWLRYVDTLTNTGIVSRTVWVAWGGDLGSDLDTVITATSSSDVLLTAADTWAVFVEQDGALAGDAPVGYAFRSPADTTYRGPGIFANDPFTDTWPNSGDDELGHIFRLVLEPGAGASLAYFVYRGLAEGLEGPQDCEFYGDCLPPPAAGSQVALAVTEVTALAARPAFCDLPPAVLSQIVNWPRAAMACRLFLPLALR